MSESDEMLADEACHERHDSVIICLGDIKYVEGVSDGSVILHNTMRFDIRMAYIGFMIQDGDINKDVLVTEIRKAIIAAVDKVAGKGLDGVPIPGGANVSHVAKSKMLHREVIAFDFS